MKMRCIPLLACCLVVVLACGSDNGSPGAAVGEGPRGNTANGACIVTPDTLDFGPVTTPPFGWVTDHATLSFTIRNAGDSTLNGRVVIDTEPAGERSAKFALTPPDTDPEFSLSPGDSAEFVIGVTMENASGGDYTGTVDLGTECGSLPLFMKAIPSQ